MADLKALAELLGQLIDEKKDALSVFSVIDANVWGRSSDGNKLGLGKVFATGLAAQKVADRYRTPYSACSGELVRAAATLNISDADQKKELFNALAALCPDRGTKPTPPSQ